MCHDEKNNPKYYAMVQVSKYNYTFEVHTSSPDLSCPVCNLTAVEIK